ncbi:MULTISPECIES: hypothetical protein [Halorussus]|uniref:hypothetical protein n=1 Tax=Halorussus TaxID=1070314 RepID=UPI0020A102B5|nr:hypothetical protein [Halorussus vallis]USZ78715.1 hypothetical protein NGM07_24705 [Halorussus vallis]
MSESESVPRRVRRGLEAHRYYSGKYGGYGMPRGPLNTEGVGPPAAIGFCSFCGTNARQTTNVRGMFDCPTCVNVWYDRRVGTQPKSLEDFFDS